MIPWNFEWAWDFGHIIFFGLFYGALAVLGLGLMTAARTTIKNLRSKGEPEHGAEH